jgi:hypothetical protein
MTSRDPDALIRTWLSEGAEDPSVQLPDRVIDAIAADIHLTRRRAGSGPWRFFDMSRIAIASVAAVVAVVVAGAALIGLNRPAASVGATAAPPSLAAAASAPASSSSTVSSSAGDLAVGSPFPLQNVIAAGSTYHSVGFTSPLAFTMPPYPSSAAGTFDAVTWGDHHTLQIHWNNEYAVTIHDGLKVSNDVCHPTAVIDTPASPDAVASWLHAAKGATVTDRTDLALAGGGVARVFDVSLSAGCYSSSDSPPGNPQIWFGAGQQHRVYAIQRGDRTVLVITWTPPEDAAATNTATNHLVASLQFR